MIGMMYVLSSNHSVVIGVALHCEITARAQAEGKFFDKGDYLKVRRAHQRPAPAIAAISG